MSSPQEIVANVIEPWAMAGTLLVTEAVLEALEAAGYSVVPTGETEHIVDFTETGFVVQHPLACRPNLLACHYSDAYFDGPLGDEPGSYRFRFNGDGEPELLGRVK